MLVPNLKKNQIVIMDNASMHKSPKIREAIEKAGCRLVYQPAYSLNLNPIEHFLAFLKKKIEALRQKFDSIFDVIQYILANLKEYIMVGSPRHFVPRDDEAENCVEISFLAMTRNKIKVVTSFFVMTSEK